MTDDRQQRINAAFTLARALGDPEAREVLVQLGWQDGTTLIPINLDGLEQHLPPTALAEAAFELASAPTEQRIVITAAWRSTALVYSDPELYAALTRDQGDDPEALIETASALIDEHAERARKRASSDG
ncbi:hypothetical protein [Streptacidiphilus sp. EB129]|uniref:hypothetical protein n=1 Tax=Streptacidiphilus sp. EB129 TaxID=3156262 RepID=UPI003518667C